MPAKALRAHAARFLTTASAHPDYRGGRIDSVDDDSARLTISLNIEMPFAMRARGVSDNGVRRIEEVSVTLHSQYPWLPPEFTLRNDFDRSLAHILPGSHDVPPTPCLVDGSLQEFFFDAGSSEAGVFRLIEQLAIWLNRAAKGALINCVQGWEPVRRDTSDAFLVASIDRLRERVLSNGGYVSFRMIAVRGSKPAELGGRVVETELIREFTAKIFGTADSDGDTVFNSVATVISPRTADSGEFFVADRYFPETVATLADLKARAAELNCGADLVEILSEIEKVTEGRYLDQPAPIAIVLCARRPCNLIGTQSPIELLPYFLELTFSKGRQSIFAYGNDTPVYPAMTLDVVSPELLRRVSGTKELSSVSILGCGSVGSKIALHLARAGVRISSVADEKYLLPHNLARYALTTKAIRGPKAQILAEEVSKVGPEPFVLMGNLVHELQSSVTRAKLFPKPTVAAINTTASLAVRESIAALAREALKVPGIEVALFGLGRGGLLLSESRTRNPNLSDLMAEFYAGIDDDRLRQLVFGAGQGLSDVQIGQGCGSLTMPMSDARLSLMTAGMAEEVLRLLDDPRTEGEVITAISDPDNPTTHWSRRRCGAFVEVPIQGPAGWTFRLSERVVREMSEERGRYPNVETGGILLGVSSERTKTVTAVDLLPAPPDSIRKPTQFVLGTKGLKRAIRHRFEQSGEAIFDVGTWHTHLKDGGPSYRDRKTAEELAAERPPPAALLIICPSKYYAIMRKSAAGESNDDK